VHRTAALLAVALTVLSLLAAPQAASVTANATARGTIDSDKFIVYRNEQANTTASSPSTFQVSFRAEVEVELSSTQCWFSCPDPSTYSYQTSDVQYTLSGGPQVVDLPGGGRLLLTYFATVSATAYAANAWLIFLSERARVVGTLYIYGRVDVPPPAPTTFDLSSIGAIQISYSLTITRTSPSPASYPVSGVITMDPSDIVLKFLFLRVAGASASVSGGTTTSGFSDKGYIGVAPRGTLSVSLCLDSPAAINYRLDGVLSYTNIFGTSSSSVSVPAGQCSTGYIDAALVPGSYRGNNTIPVTFSSGALSFTVGVEVDVPGVLARAPRPLVILYYDTSSGVWNGTLYIYVEASSYGGYAAHLEASGSVSMQGGGGGFSCGGQDFYSSGVFMCSFGVPGPQVVDSASASVSVTLSGNGVSVSDTANVNATILAPYTVAGVASTIYRAALYIGAGLVFATLMLYVVAHAARTMGRAFIDPEEASYSLTAATAYTAIVALAPYLYYALLAFFYQIPEFSSYLVTVAPSPGDLLRMPPDQVVARMAGFYDALASQMAADYATYVEGPVISFFAQRIPALTAIIALLAVVGVAAAFWNTGVAMGSARAIEFILSYLNLLISMAASAIPVIVSYKVLMAFSQAFVLVGSGIALAMLLVGGILAVLPGRVQAIRGYEEILGAGFLYLLAVPPLGVLIYSVYMTARGLALEMISAISDQGGVLNFAVGVAELVAPFTPVLKMYAFIGLGTMAAVSTVSTVFYILSRMGVMAAIGTALASLIRRH